jgi:hypothetical protein
MATPGATVRGTSGELAFVSRPGVDLHDAFAVVPLSASTKNPSLLDRCLGDGHACPKPHELRRSVRAEPHQLVRRCTADVVRLPGLSSTQDRADSGRRGTQAGYRILEAFGPSALMTSSKLDALNEGRAPNDFRSVADSLALFDVDANGTVVGDAGSGVLITTARLRPATFSTSRRSSSLVRARLVARHFAGVGFGGENALTVHALEMARKGHGDGVGALVTPSPARIGTRTNSKTDLTMVQRARHRGFVSPAHRRCHD